MGWEQASGVKECQPAARHDAGSPFSWRWLGYFLMIDIQNKEFRLNHIKRDGLKYPWDYSFAAGCWNTLTGGTSDFDLEDPLSAEI